MPNIRNMWEKRKSLPGGVKSGTIGEQLLKLKT